MNTKLKILLALVAAALLAVPVALAAPGGNSAEKAHANAAKGMAKAEAARHADAESTDLEDDGNATAEKGPRKLGHAENHGRHHGWAKAMLHVPDKVKAFFEAVLGGLTPSEARRGAAA